MNVTRAIGRQLNEADQTVELLSPSGTKNPNIPGTAIKFVGRSKGHLWEQISLPFACPDQLLNFCNTAPLFKSNQVVCIHDANIFVEPKSYSRRFRLFYRALQPLIAHRAAKVATVSAYSASKIAEHLSLKISDIIVLPNGHEHVQAWDSSKAIQAPNSLKSFRIDQSRPFVLAIGSRARHKNLAMLIGLAEKLSNINVDLVIAGGDGNIFSYDNLDIGANILHLSYVTDHDLAYLLERALCLAFPSLTEGFGLPALEAMALDCPVISTDRASLPEICGDAALLAPPDEPERWMHHIRELLISRILRADLIGRGRLQALKFSWRKTADGYLNLMDK